MSMEHSKSSLDDSHKIALRPRNSTGKRGLENNIMVFAFNREARPYRSQPWDNTSYSVYNQMAWEIMGYMYTGNYDKLCFNLHTEDRKYTTIWGKIQMGNDETAGLIHATGCEPGAVNYSRENYHYVTW